MKIFKYASILLALISILFLSSCSSDEPTAGGDNNTPAYMSGTTTSTSPDGVAFTSQDTEYEVVLDYELMQASLYINGARFAERMPSLNIEFLNLAFTTGVDNSIHIDVADEFIPTMSGRPQPSFPISNLVADYTIGKGMTLNFNCTLNGMMTYSVECEVEY